MSFITEESSSLPVTLRLSPPVEFMINLSIQKLIPFLVPHLILSGLRSINEKGD